MLRNELTRECRVEILDKFPFFFPTSPPHPLSPAPPPRPLNNTPPPPIMSATAFLAGSPCSLAAPRRGVTSRSRRVTSTRPSAAMAPSLPNEEAKILLERDGYKMLDVRSWKAYDREHLTKPPQCTANMPLADDEDPAGGGFVAKVQEQGFRVGVGLVLFTRVILQS
jgi:hypothetical protein